VETGGHTTFRITAALNVTFDNKLTNSMELSPRISQHFIETEDLLPCSKEPYTGPYPEPDRSRLYHPSLSFLRSILILSYHLCLDLQSGHFPSGFRAKILYVFLFFFDNKLHWLSVIHIWNGEYAMVPSVEVSTSFLNYLTRKWICLAFLHSSLNGSV
jgi:hypothetical protein